MPSTCGSESLRFARIPMRSMRPDCSSVDFTRGASDAGSLGPDPAFSLAPHGLRSGVADRGVSHVAEVREAMGKRNECAVGLIPENERGSIKTRGTEGSPSISDG